MPEKPLLIHTPIKQTPKDHTCNYGTKTLIIQQCHHILHPMAQRLLSYNNVIISSISYCHRLLSYNHVILSSISIIIQRNLPHTNVALSSTPWHKHSYYIPLLSFPASHDTKTLSYTHVILSSTPWNKNSSYTPISSCLPSQETEALIVPPPISSYPPSYAKTLHP